MGRGFIQNYILGEKNALVLCFRSVGPIGRVHEREEIRDKEKKVPLVS